MMSTKESCRHYVETAGETLHAFIRQHQGWRYGFLGALECRYCCLGFHTPDLKLRSLILVLSGFIIVWSGLFFLSSCFLFLEWECLNHIIVHWECVICIDFTKSLKGDFDILSSVRLWIIFTFNYTHFNHEMTMIPWCPRVGCCVFNVKYPR